MNILIKTFASVYDICGFADKEMEVPSGHTVTDVVQMLIEKHSGLHDVIDDLLFAVNGEYCNGTRMLAHDDVLAIFPPVSGG